MAIAFFIQFETGGPIFGGAHPLGEFFSQRAGGVSVQGFRVRVNVDFPSLAAGVLASPGFALESGEESGVDGIHNAPYGE